MNWLRFKKLFLQNWPLVVLCLVPIVFFWKFFLHGLLPIPADTIVAMYHPWLERIWDGFTGGVPFKNFLITDPVRQQYPWRELAMSLFKRGEWPLWNPYSQGGVPLLANLQGAVFYPLNLLFFLFPFNFAWGVLIFLQPFLAGFFLYFYLRQLKLRKWPALLGALSFSFSGFFVAWLEWGTILHVALWLPLILLAIEKIIEESKRYWGVVLIFSLVVSFFAGHLQTSFYLVSFSLLYLVWRLFPVKKSRSKLIRFFVISYSLFILLTLIQWLPLLQFIKLSGRDIDQINWQEAGWFLPWQHLTQFLAPDFFGNPTTLNYWGVWNYAEFIGYLGVIPLGLALLAIFYRRDKRTCFFSLSLLLVLSFTLPTPWAKLPYQLKIPLFSTSQPTRLLFIVDFCLAVLAALGLEIFLSKRKFFLPLLVLGFLYGAFWVFVLLGRRFWPEADWIVNLAVTRRNLFLPTGIFVLFGGILMGFWLLPRLGLKKKIVSSLLMGLLFIVTLFDLWRFGWKFNPFTRENWLFPQTETIEFLQRDKEIFRLMKTDRRLFPPNFSLVYDLQTIEGYDPLYLLRYGELVAASERGEPNILPPFGFNRIITPHNYESKVIDLLNVKYILALSDLNSPKLDLVFQEGQTRVYENKDAFPRAFMVYDYQLAQNKEEAINLLLSDEVNLKETAILEEEIPFPFTETKRPLSRVKIKEYQENRVVVEVETEKDGFLILVDSFYPGWQATVDGGKTKIYRVDYHFRGIMVPEGTHEMIFKYGWL